MTSGQFVSFLYVTLFILVPMVSHVFFGQADGSIYYYTHPAPWVLVLIVGLWLLIASSILRIKVPYVRRPILKLHKLETFLHKRMLALAISIALTVGVLYSSSFIAFRYSYAGISSEGWQLVLIIVLRSLISIILLWLLVTFRSQNLHIRLSDRISVWLLALVLLYTSNGTLSTLNAMLFLMFAITPKHFANFVFTKTNSSMFSLQAFWKTLFSTSVFIGLVFLALIVGESIKNSSTFDLDFQVVTFSIKWLTIRIIDGISSHYYALVQFFDPQTYRILEQYDYPLNYYLGAIEFRINLLLGYETIRPDVQSLSRLNFLVNSYKTSINEGTSPGLFASFCYILPLPIGLFVALIYLRWVISLLDQCFYLPGFKLSIFGGIFILQNLLFLYEAPFDILLIIDNIPILVLALWLFARMRTDIGMRQTLKKIT